MTILCRTGGESQKRKFPLDYPPGIWYDIRWIQYARVAQLDRAADTDSEGRAFEPHRAYQSRHGFHGGIFCVKQHQSPVASWIAEWRSGFLECFFDSVPLAAHRDSSSLWPSPTDRLRRPPVGGYPAPLRCGRNHLRRSQFPRTAPSEPVP